MNGTRLGRPIEILMVDDNNTFAKIDVEDMRLL
jgi:hypothetical protein